eukprot:TRINITY_DN110977_c0_g1_i1.p1 TRINITY_DN110977_c0_g1~~TRINITY_DN110977_c0_g1_i1.p1  ORF type:complete len:749 (+),score=258.52 TRINITY_DN110977_c0_g1_i1:120-2366(+)
MTWVQRPRMPRQRPVAAPLFHVPLAPAVVDGGGSAASSSSSFPSGAASLISSPGQSPRSRGRAGSSLRSQSPVVAQLQTGGLPLASADVGGNRPRASTWSSSPGGQRVGGAALPSSAASSPSAAAAVVAPLTPRSAQVAASGAAFHLPLAAASAAGSSVVVSQPPPLGSMPPATPQTYPRGVSPQPRASFQQPLSASALLAQALISGAAALQAGQPVPKATVPPESVAVGEPLSTVPESAQGEAAAVELASGEQPMPLQPCGVAASFVGAARTAVVLSELEKKEAELSRQRLEQEEKLQELHRHGRALEEEREALQWRDRGQEMQLRMLEEQLQLQALKFMAERQRFEGEVRQAEDATNGALERERLAETREEQAAAAENRAVQHVAYIESLDEETRRVAAERVSAEEQKAAAAVEQTRLVAEALQQRDAAANAEEQGLRQLVADAQHATLAVQEEHAATQAAAAQAGQRAFEELQCREQMQQQLELELAAAEQKAELAGRKHRELAAELKEDVLVAQEDKERLSFSVRKSMHSAAEEVAEARDEMTAVDTMRRELAGLKEEQQDLAAALAEEAARAAACEEVAEFDRLRRKSAEDSELAAQQHQSTLLEMLLAARDHHDELLKELNQESAERSRDLARYASELKSCRDEMSSLQKDLDLAHLRAAARGGGCEPAVAITSAFDEIATTSTLHYQLPKLSLLSHKLCDTAAVAAPVRVANSDGLSSEAEVEIDPFSEIGVRDLWSPSAA